LEDNRFYDGAPMTRRIRRRPGLTNLKNSHRIIAGCLSEGGGLLQDPL
jgi:hypothetical protein